MNCGSARMCMLTAWVCAVTGIDNVASAAGDEVRTKAEILELYEAQQGRITDLSVAFTVDLLEGQVPSIESCSYDIILKGEKYLVKRRLATAKGMTEQWTAYNGTLATLYNSAFDGRIRNAAIAHSRPEKHPTEGTAWFDMMLLNQFSQAELEEGWLVQSLETLLKSAETRIAPALEAVGEAPCHVLELYATEVADNPRMRIWLDAARGFMPVKQVHYVGPAFESPLIEYEIVSATEVMTGFWVATEGVKRSYPAIPNVPELSVLHEWSILLDINKETGASLVAVNTVKDDSVFDAWLHVPGGTRVGDEKTGEVWLAAADNYEAIADAAMAAVPAQLMPGNNAMHAEAVLIPSSGTTAEQPTATISVTAVEPWQDYRWWLVMVGAAAVAVLPHVLTVTGRTRLR